MTLKTTSKHEFGTKSSDCKILAKYLGIEHWDLYIFCKVTNGNIYVEHKEVSCDSIYSPCYSRIIRGTREELNLLWTQGLQNGYESLGWFEQDRCGAYRKAKEVK